MTEDGFAVPALAMVAALVVAALMGISVDLWRVITSHQRLVAITDAAAVAGSGAVDVDLIYSGVAGAPTLDPDGAIELACGYLTASLSMTQCPGPQADVTVGLDSVTVTARRRVPLTLLGLLLAPAGSDAEIEIAATATAFAVRVAIRER